jgi:hypothetical protein
MQLDPRPCPLLLVLDCWELGITIHYSALTTDGIRVTEEL